MHALSRPRATTTSMRPPNCPPAPTQHPRGWGWAGRGVRPVAIAVAATAAIVVTAAVNQPVATLTAADGI